MSIRCKREMRGRAAKCYYDNEACEGELWQCKTCRQWFCQAHWHETDKGRNVECVGCERMRKACVPEFPEDL